MSLADSAIVSVAAAFNAIHADHWRFGGTMFFGEAQSEAPNILETELGTDSRERVFLYCDRPAPALVRGSRIEGKGCLWQVIGELDDNPTNDRVRFEIQKIAARDT